MSIAILTNYRNPATWKNALQAKLPDTKIDVFNESKEAVNAEFLVCWKPEKDQLNAFPNLKVIQSLGAGVDHIFDTNTIGTGVKVVRIIDERLSADMWEYVLAATMYHLKDFAQYKRQESYQYWRPKRYKTIPETTVSILGLGQIGGYVAERFVQLGFKTQGWSNSPKNIKQVKSFVGEKGLSELLQQTDILINILPLTAATRGILNEKLLSQLPKGAYLISVGRGGHLVEKDLIPLIDNGHLAGASLDVFHTEPLPKKHPFWTHPKIQITPHVASLTNLESAINQVVENYQRMNSAKELLNEVSANKGY